jgi:hypothetical protein
MRSISGNKAIPSREVALNRVLENGLLLRTLGEIFKKDVEIVLAAVNQNGMALQYAHTDLKKCDEIAIEAIIQHIGAISCMDFTLKTNDKFLLQILERVPSSNPILISEKTGTTLSKDFFIGAFRFYHEKRKSLGAAEHESIREISDNIHMLNQLARGDLTSENLQEFEKYKLSIQNQSQSNLSDNSNASVYARPGVR